MTSKVKVGFDGVWKKFRRGERHDSLRDLIPSVAKRLVGKAPPRDALEGQEFWALRDVSFEVLPGQALGIIGHNGAGKSTALKLLTRILKPTRGTSEVRGRVGALIEVAAGFHPDLTGRENVFLQGAIMGMTRAEIERRFDQIVAFSGVEPFIDTPLKRYSSGMNARLGFSVAAHLEPQVLIIDEVLSVGDSMFQARCLDRIRTLKQSGVALVFVSHNLPAVESLCDQALWLNQGSVMFTGAPREAIRRYLARAQESSSGQGGRVAIDDTPEYGFRQVQLVNERGEDTDSLISGETATLNFTLVSGVATRDAIVGFSLRTLDGHIVFGENNSVSTGPLRLGDGRQVRAAVTFRSLALPEGRYYINMALESPASAEPLHRIERAVTFDIEVPQEANRLGSLRLATEWTIDEK